MQVPLHALKPALHAKPHDVPLQVATALAGSGHGVHDVPHALTLPLDTHLPPQLCIPAEQEPPQAEVEAIQVPLHTLKPALQAKPHDVPLQVATALAGTAHGAHDVPHEFTLLLARHMPAQLWVPVGQVPRHVDEDRMQVPLQSLNPPEQRPSQRLFEQTADPFAGAEQGVHDEPQLAGEVLLTQFEPQT